MPSLEKSATHSVHEYKYKAWWGPSSPTSSKMESNDHLSAKEAKTPEETAEKRRQGAGNPQKTEAEVSPLGWSKIFLPLAPDFFPFLGWVSVPAQVRRPPAGSPGLQDMMLSSVLNGCLSNQSSTCWRGRARVAGWVGRGLPSPLVVLGIRDTPLVAVGSGQLCLNSCLQGHYCPGSGTQLSHCLPAGDRGRAMCAVSNRHTEGGRRPGSVTVLFPLHLGVGFSGHFLAKRHPSVLYQLPSPPPMPSN